MPDDGLQLLLQLPDELLLNRSKKISATTKKKKKMKHFYQRKMDGKPVSTIKVKNRAAIITNHIVL
jgi:hypothetical protein